MKDKDSKKYNTPKDYAHQQGVDKSPGEERGKKEKVTEKDLKGKKVDADPEREDGKPAE
jgi:hypothetical protein